MKTNILDYLDWRGDLSFKRSPFNEVDSLVFATLMYLDFEQSLLDARSTYPTLSDAVDAFFKHHDYKTYKIGAITPNEVKDLALKAKETKRYGQLLLLDYIKEVSIEERSQFCGGAFLLDDNNIVVIFEGTDDSIVGWYEDAMLAVYDEVLAQKKAVNFLNQIGERFPNKQIYICGHSKGGNLSFYSAIKANKDVKSRIINIYNIDGPGLVYSRYTKEEAKIIDDLAINILPNSAIIGSLFEIRGEIRITQSKAKNIFQHDPFTFLVQGNKFLKTDKFSKTTLNIQKDIQKYMLGTKPEEILQCLDDIYTSLYNEKKFTLLDLKFIDHNIIFRLAKLVKADKNVIKKFVAILINNNAFIK